jgi:transposase-like protein
MAGKQKAKSAAANAPKANKSTRQTFTPEQRAKILAEAKALKLTGAQVAKKHGISMVTYYLWRKRSGVSRPHAGGRSVAGLLAGDGLGAQVRVAVQAKVREMLPGIVREEVGLALVGVFASPAKTRGARRA